MTLFALYAANPKVKATLSRRLGDQGFSLIELVVVVAVLAILAAIAIPAFTSINDEARVSGAKTSLANLAKECAVKLVGTGSKEYNMPTLNSYTITEVGPGTAGTCGNTDVFRATPSAGVSLPIFTLATSTGAKTCEPSGDGSNAGLGCNGYTPAVEGDVNGEGQADAVLGTW